MAEKTNKSSRLSTIIVILFVIIAVTLILTEIFTNVDAAKNESNTSTNDSIGNLQKENNEIKDNITRMGPKASRIHRMTVT